MQTAGTDLHLKLDLRTSSLPTRVHLLPTFEDVDLPGQHHS
jgi:hypothetical protein